MEIFSQNNEHVDALIANFMDAGLAVLGAIVILIIGFLIASFAEGRFLSLLRKSERIDVTVSKFLASLVKYTIIIMTVIAVLGQFGVETTSLVAVVGAAGLAIGLALQGTLSNVAAGVMLLIFRPFKVGQFVDVGGQSGVVKGVTLFMTELDTGDNVRIIIPNSAVWGGSIKNFNHHSIRRLDQVYGISYDDNIDKAIDIIKTVLASDERCKTDPEAIVAVTALGDSSVNILVRVWCDASVYWPLNWHLLKTVKQAFDKEDITIPFPCRTIYMEKDNA